MADADRCSFKAACSAFGKRLPFFSQKSEALAMRVSPSKLMMMLQAAVHMIACFAVWYVILACSTTSELTLFFEGWSSDNSAASKTNCEMLRHRTPASFNS